MSRGADPLAPFLERQRVLVLDGGLATTLEERGYALDATLWSAGMLREDPDAVRAVHLAFLEAGADVIATVSYQASFAGFDALGIADADAVRYFGLSVELAVEARDAFWTGARATAARLRPLVAASVGPYGAYLADGSEYDGRYGVSTGELHGFHARRFRLLAESAADLVAFETVPSIDEARVLLELLSEQDDAWAWISFACRDGAHLNDGTAIEEVAGLCDGAPGLCAVAVNCTAPAHVTELIGRVRGETSLPVLVYPNSGERWDGEGKAWTGEGVADLVGLAPTWLAAGAEGVGGCCRVGPEVIRAMRRAILREP